MTTSITGVSGNPRPGSRTLRLTEAVVARVAQLLEPAGPVDQAVVDLSALAGQLFAPTHPTTDAALEWGAASAVVVVATPVDKASDPGLLKSFLDLDGTNGLRGTVAPPVTVSANPAHLLASEVHLRPLLVELGASVPTRALTVAEPAPASLGDGLDTWFSEHGALLAGAAAVRTHATAVRTHAVAVRTHAVAVRTHATAVRTHATAVRTHATAVVGS